MEARCLIVLNQKERCTIHPFTEQLSQALAWIGHLPPASQTSGTVYVSSPVDMSQFRRAIALINVGVFPSGTAVAGWYAANNVTFTTAGTASSGAATNSTTGPIGTTCVFSTATRGEKMEIRADQLPSGYRWLQLQISVSSAAIPLFSVEVLGADPNYLPSSQFESTGYATGTTGSAIVDQTVIS